MNIEEAVTAGRDVGAEACTCRPSAHNIQRYEEVSTGSRARSRANE